MSKTKLEDRIMATFQRIEDALLRNLIPYVVGFISGVLYVSYLINRNP